MISEDQPAPCLPAGRYEFKDSGIYIGEWLNERAVGLGLITKDKCQGEFTGLWDQGSEKSGVFLWPNAPGAMYEGEWAMNRRNGFGVFYREDWIIMGKFQDDFILTGMKSKDLLVGRFEGDFENGFPSFGVETYADGGSYAGEYKNGIRQGFGVRRSIPYGDVINFFPEEAAIAAELACQRLTGGIHDGPFVAGKLTRRGSFTSQRSGDAIEPGEDNQEEEEPYGGNLKNPIKKPGPPPLRLSSKYKCGFVLSSQRSELLVKRQAKLDSRSYTKEMFSSYGGKHGRGRARSLSNIFNPHTKESHFRRTGSTSRSVGPPVHSNPGVESIFNLDQVDAIDPETVEVYAGQWDADARHGYGVCVRSDGVSYEGQWVRNQRHGYGQTKFRDGTIELGRYQNGKLIFLAWNKGAKPHMFLYNYHITREVASAVKKANYFADLARDKAKQAQNKLHQVKDITEKAEKAGQVAREYSLETRELVLEMYPDFDQPGIKYLEDMVRLMKLTKHGNKAFENALQSAKDVLSGITTGLDRTAPDGGRTKEIESSVPPEVGLELPPKIVLPQDHEAPEGSSPISRAGSFRRKRVKREESLMPARRGKQKQQTLAEAAANLALPSKIAFSPLPSATADTQKQAKGSSNLLKVPNGPTAGDEEYSEEEDLSQLSSEGSFKDLPNVTEIKAQSDIPKIPLAKLFNNPTLFGDHFDQYAGTVYEPLDARYGGKAGAIAYYAQMNGGLNFDSNHKYPGKHQPIKQEKIICASAPLINPRPLHVCGVLDFSNASETEKIFECMDGLIIGPDLEPVEITTLGAALPDGRMVSAADFAAKTNSLRPMMNRKDWQPRRRTLPALLTQEPLEDVPRNPFTPSSRRLLACRRKLERQNLPKSYGFVKHQLSNHEHPPFGQMIPIGRERELTPGITRMPKVSALNQNQVYHIVEDGVRKRLHKSPTTTLGQMLGMPNFPNEKLAGDDEYSIINDYEYPIDEYHPLWIPTDSSCVEIRSKVIVNSPQDELPFLPASFCESTTNIAKDVKELSSMPDVRVCGSMSEESGIAPAELITLSQISQRQRAEELARKNEGEIVIRLSDLIDWIWANSYWISVLIFNIVLAYVFLKMVPKKPNRS